MSATVAAALKKIAVALLTDKKALKTIGGIVLGVLIIIIMPIVAVVRSTRIACRPWWLKICLPRNKLSCRQWKIPCMPSRMPCSPPVFRHE